MRGCKCFVGIPPGSIGEKLTLVRRSQLKERMARWKGEIKFLRKAGFPKDLQKIYTRKRKARIKQDKLELKRIEKNIKETSLR